jgi:hypothetical protein
MNRISRLCCLLILTCVPLFGQTADVAATHDSQADAPSLIVNKFWHPWLTDGSPQCNFIIPSYAVADDGLWIGGYFNQAEKGRIFKVSLPDFQTESIDTADGKEVTSMACSTDALYASCDRFVNHLMVKDGMSRYDLSTRTWESRRLATRFKQDFYLLDGSLYLDGNGSPDGPPVRESAIIKYDWNADKTTLLSSSRRRPGQNQFDDTPAYDIAGIFLGPGNKPCVTIRRLGTFYIQEKPGTWPTVFDGTFGDNVLTGRQNALVLNQYGEITLMDPLNPAPVPLMAPLEPIHRKGAALERAPWAGQAEWDSPGRDVNIWTNTVAYHQDTLYILVKPKEKGGTFELLCYQKGQGNASLLMVWKYDALRDAIVLDFPWHKTNFRDGRTLIDILKKRASSKDLKPEEWDVAFDELLSRPDNFPQAWKPRIIEDNQSLSGPPGLPGPVNNFFTGVLKDAEGKEHLLVLNLASHDIVPSDVFLICYLFDAKGNWEEGGECGGGGQFAGRKVKLDEKGQVLSYDITSNAPLITYNFTVQAGKLGFAVLEDGKPLDPAGYKNAGVTPFRDLGDL